MRTCVINGDMSSDRASENYPTVTYCDECFESLDADSYVMESGYDPTLDSECTECGKTEQEEREENNG